MKHSVIPALFLALVCISIAPAQTNMFLAVGGGVSESVGMTGTFGVEVTPNNWSVTSADVTARVNSLTNKRALYSTFRTGGQRIIAPPVNIGVGTLTVAVAADIGAFNGGGDKGLNLSTGGTLIYEHPRLKNFAFYGSYRAVRGPTDSPTDASVKTGISAGIILKLTKQ